MSAESGIEKSSLPRDLAKGLFYCLWQVIRVPTLAVLTILEPLVSFLLVGTAMALTLVSIMFRYASTVQHYPFWGMLALALGCVGILGVYRMLMGWLSR